MRTGRIGISAGSELTTVGLATVVRDLDCVNDVAVAASVMKFLDMSVTPAVVVVGGEDNQRRLAQYLKRRTAPGGVGVVLMVRAGQRADLAGWLGLGVHALVSEDATADDLCRAVGAVAAGDCYVQRTLVAELRSFVDGVPALGVELAPGVRLTERETEIVRLVCRGMSNDDIARYLVVSVRTVKYHVSNVLAKLGARNRAEVIAMMYGRTRA